MAARGNYLGQDRMDTQFAAKEASRFTSRPKEQDRSSAKRLAFQRMPERIVARSDADFAGCKRARRSDSGGVATLGGRCVKTYSQTQETTASSSGESELLWDRESCDDGVGHLLDDLGVEVKAQVKTDSSAAKSIASRRGAGRLRHADVRELRAQDRAGGEGGIVGREGER